MAPHSWKIPRMEEPGRLQSMGWLSNFLMAAEHGSDSKCWLNVIHPMPKDAFNPSLQ